MRIPKTFKKAITEEKDSLFTYPASRDKDSLTLRRIYFQLDDGTKEYLVTNLMSNQIDIEKFFDLYGLRWSVESKYRELKNRFEIEAFNSIKPIGIQQEFFAVMYLSNLAAIVKLQADSMIISSPDTKHNYQSNRSYILNRIKCNIILLLISSPSVCRKKILEIIEETSKIRSTIRPNRKFGRYRRHTRRRYYNHMKSCI